VDESQRPCTEARVVERNRYFSGKLMTAADFAAEQEYLLDRSRSHNRLHGFGTVCGLAVLPTDPPSGAVLVEPGVALDCCGREIVLTESVVLDVVQPAPTPRRGGRVLVTVCYGEEAIAATPGLGGDGEQNPEPGRIRETPRFEMVVEPRREVSEGQQQGRGEGVVPCPPCAQPAVTLARIDLSEGERLSSRQIDNGVRRYVSLGSSHATAGVGMSGGEDPSDRMERLERRVKILWGAVGLLAAVAAWWRRHR
jgi:hypothetical protein